MLGTMRLQAHRIPSAAVVAEARTALRTLVQAMPKDAGALLHVRGDGAQEEVEVHLPGQAMALLLEVLGQMAAGNAVTVVPVHAELTARQAAQILNVSRPYLIGLLDAGKIPHRRVGTHRRIRLTDLMAYKKQDDARRDEALAELTRQSQELGLGY